MKTATRNNDCPGKKNKRKGTITANRRTDPLAKFGWDPFVMYEKLQPLRL